MKSLRKAAHFIAELGLLALILFGVWAVLKILSLGLDAFERETGILSFLEEAFGFVVVIFLGFGGAFLAIHPLIERKKQEREWGMAFFGLIIFGFMCFVLWKNL